MNMTVTLCSYLKIKQQTDLATTKFFHTLMSQKLTLDWLIVNFGEKQAVGIAKKCIFLFSNFSSYWAISSRIYALRHNYWTFLRARASIAIAHISYGNSVCRLSVTTQYRLETTSDRYFGFSPYDSLVSLVFRDKISCH